ncbi:MAG: hypothetical protein IPK07_12745 [Deltaproteobacteria bacterium]|nr:hypothetical protein [Deltaproteobacteria bacterium]
MKLARRLAEVAWIAAKYRTLTFLDAQGVTAARRWAGADPSRPLTAPVATRLAFTELGTTFIKLGQVIASGEGLFPQPYVDELQSLLDQVPPFSSAEAKRLVERAIDGRVEDHFAEFAVDPMAAASVAQVHPARLKTGEEVVVKVQRPGIGTKIDMDLKILAGAAWFADRFLKSAQLLNPVAVVEDFASTIHEELDFEREARNMEEFNRAMTEAGLTDCVAPRVYWTFTRKNVLVMERFHGLKLTDTDALLPYMDDAERFLIRGMRAWMECLVVHGFFHGDVHAGNFLYLTDGRIGFLDFGIVGRFRGWTHKLMSRYLVAFNTGNFQRLAECMVLLGAPKHAIDLDAFAKDLEEAYGPLIFKTFKDIDYGEILPKMNWIARKHGLRLLREEILTTKQFIYFDRYAKVIAPNLNMFTDRRLMPEVMKSARRHEGRDVAVDSAMAEKIQDHYFSGQIDEILATERGGDEDVSLVVPPWQARSTAPAEDDDETAVGAGPQRRAKRAAIRPNSLMDAEVLMWEGAAGHFMGPVYAQAFDRPDEDLYRLYEKAKHEQWNASTDVDWSALSAMRALPPIVRQATANVQTQLHYGELGALMVTSKIVAKAPDLIATYYGSTQVMDEARHVEFFSRVIRGLGVTGQVSPHLERLCKEVFESDTAEELLLGMQVIIEGLAQTTFVEGAALARKMDLEASGIEELKAMNLLFADYLMRYVGHDESRHVAFGVYYLAQRFPELSKARKDELQKKSDHWSSLVDATIASTRDDMAMVGIDVDHLAMRCTRDRQHRLARIGLLTS